MTTTKPYVLHVDDDPDELRGLEAEARAQGRIELAVCHPQDVTEKELRRACLILVDFKIERWPGRANASELALKPPNGLALLSVLQEAAYELDRDSPRAFALFTAMVKDVARGLVPRPHIVARAHNLEWVFDKTATDPATRAQRAAELAEAVQSLPNPWPGDSREQAAAALLKWLAIPSDASWRDAGWQGVLRCRPPIHEFAEHTHGIGVLRWMLHRVLPYPAIVFDDVHLAARLRIDLASLRTELEDSGGLKKLLEPARYTGGLSAFVGRRWWRAAVDGIVFDLAANDPASVSLLHEQLKQLAPALKTLGADPLFPVLNENFEPKDQLARAGDVIEIIPDDWPPFADSAWALLSDVKDHELLSAVVAASETQGD